MDPYGVIVFITTHSEFAPITYAYKVSAFDFIAKDSPIDTIKQHLVDCFENLLNNRASEKKEETRHLVKSKVWMNVSLRSTALSSST